MTLRNKLPSTQSLFRLESAACTLNFTDAGVLLNMTQPAISKNIAALETHLATRLFVKGKSRLALTLDGEILYRAVHLSLAAVDPISHRTW